MRPVWIRNQLLKGLLRVALLNILSIQQNLTTNDLTEQQMNSFVFYQE